jgi:hypothetical protein
MPVALGLCAAGAPHASRREVGEAYARAFSDDAHNRRVTWDDRACTFSESAAEVRRSDLPVAVQVTRIPIARVTVAIKSPIARVGILDVLFHCDPPLQHCIARTRQYGSTVVGTDFLTEHAMALGGSLADTPRVIAELGRLRDACVVARVDGGA